MAWPANYQPFGPNRSPLLAGLASDGSGYIIPVAVDRNTGEILVNSAGGSSGSLVTGQQTVNTSAIQVSSTNQSLSNGIIIKSLSTNAALIYVGLSTVTTALGDVLEPGEARGYAVGNLNLLYIISPTSITDKITFSAS